MPETAHTTLADALGSFQPDTGLILGSGLGFFVEASLQPEGSLAYADIPGFPVSTVAGHAGRFVWGSLGPRKVLCMQGRFHYYEGYPLSEIIRPIRLMKEVGVQTLFITNAAGGIRRDFRPGDLMLLMDHINFIGENPLRGPNNEALGPRFPDMSQVYDPALRDLARKVALSNDLLLREGVYLATSGPSFETPAEVRAFRILGADAVGMSTVPEAIAARHLGMRVAAVSCITNLAAGLSHQTLTHEEVAETANRVSRPFAAFLRNWIAAS
jgi:purine-nucleoside phosphorylase